MTKITGNFFHRQPTKKWWMATVILTAVINPKGLFAPFFVRLKRLHARLKRTCLGIHFKGGGAKRRWKYSSKWMLSGMRVPSERSKNQQINNDIFGWNDGEILVTLKLAGEVIDPQPEKSRGCASHNFPDINTASRSVTLAFRSLSLSKWVEGQTDMPPLTRIRLAQCVLPVI